MRLIVLFFLSWGAFAQDQEEVVAQHRGALTEIYHQVYGDNEMEGEMGEGEMGEGEFGQLVLNLANCTYGGQHEVSQVVEGLEREECNAVIQGAFEGGVSNADMENAIGHAAQIAATDGEPKP